MKITITPVGMGSQVFDEAGKDITADLGVTEINIRATATGPTEARLHSELPEEVLVDLLPENIKIISNPLDGMSTGEPGNDRDLSFFILGWLLSYSRVMPSMADMVRNKTITVEDVEDLSADDYVASCFQIAIETIKRIKTDAQ